MNTQDKIIANLLLRPEIAKFVELNETWFDKKEYKQIVKAFIENPDIERMSDIEKTIRGNDPLSKVFVEDLEKMREEGEYVDCQRKTGLLLKDLQIEYLENVFEERTREYLQRPTNANRRAIQDALNELGTAKQPKKNGDLDETIKGLERRLHEEVSGGLKSFGKVDLVLGGGFKGSQLITVGARPAVGKSAFAVNLADKAISRNDGVKVDFFSLEMSVQQVYERFVTLRTGIETRKVQEAKTLATDKERKILAEYYNRKEPNLRIYDDLIYVDDIIRTIRTNAQQANNGYIAVIDYLGLVRVKGASKSQYEMVSQITRDLKVLTNELDIPILLLSQLNRGLEGRHDKTPMLADLRDSGSVEQDSNVVGFLYEAENEHGEMVTLFDIQKNREGTIGKIAFRFNKPKMLFESIF